MVFVTTEIAANVRRVLLAQRKVCLVNHCYSHRIQIDALRKPTKRTPYILAFNEAVNLDQTTSRCRGKN